MTPAQRLARARRRAERAQTAASRAYADYYREVAAVVAEVGATDTARLLGVNRARIYQLLDKAKRT